MDTEHEWAHLIAALTQQADVGGFADRRGQLQRGLELASTVGTDGVGSSVTEATADGFHTPVSSNQLALELDLVQYAAADGPCVAACRDARPHSITVMASTPQFPAFTAAAMRLGVRSSLSLPLPGVHRPAALNLYARNPSAFEAPRARATAELLARCIARLLPGSSPPTDPQGDPAFDRALRRRRHIQHAEEILNGKAGLDPTAFHTLVQRSRVEQRSIFDVAQDVIDGAVR